MNRDKSSEDLDPLIEWDYDDDLPDLGQDPVKSLIKLLNDDDPNIVWKSAYALSKHSDKRALKPLISKISFVDPKSIDTIKSLIQLSVLYALGTQKYPEAVEPIIAFMQQAKKADDIDLYLASGWALGMIQDIRAIPYLLEGREIFSKYKLNQPGVYVDYVVYPEDPNEDQASMFYDYFQGEYKDSPNDFETLAKNIFKKYSAEPELKLLPKDRQIKEIIIEGLFHKYTHRIPFNTSDQITIIYGPNGTGKTTIQYILNCLFEGNLDSLFKIPFHKFKIKFLDNSEINVFRHYFFLANEAITNNDYNSILYTSNLYHDNSSYFEFRDADNQRVLLLKYKGLKLTRDEKWKKDVDNQNKVNKIKALIQSDLKSRDFLIKIKEREMQNLKNIDQLYPNLANENPNKKINQFIEEFREIGGERLPKLLSTKKDLEKRIADIDKNTIFLPKSQGILEINDMIMLFENDISRLTCDLDRLKKDLSLNEIEIAEITKKISGLSPDKKEKPEIKQNRKMLIKQEKILQSNKNKILQEINKIEAEIAHIKVPREDFHIRKVQYENQIQIKNQYIDTISSIDKEISNLQEKYAQYSDIYDKYIGHLPSSDDNMKISHDFINILKETNHNLCVIFIDSQRLFFKLGLEQKEHFITFFEYLDDLPKLNENSSKIEEIIIKKYLFTTIVESFLVSKGIYITDDNSIEIYDKIDNTRIFSEQLSSGEQHLIILFYKLLFLTEKNSTVLIDEPEISLHVSWKRQFIDKIRDTIQYLPLDVLISTHSPAIIHDSMDLSIGLEG